MLVGGTSPWCEAIAFITTSSSPYFLAKSTPILTCDPSISKSIALPMSCNRPALLARFTFSPSSLAIIPAKLATSIEWVKAFCP